MFDTYELRMSSAIKAIIKSRLDAEETRFIIAYRLSVPTRSSRRQQVLAFGTLGMVIADRFLGITPRFFTRWQHLDRAFRCRELRLVSFKTCSNVQRVGCTRS
ncbi:hypothetical protein ALC60_08864 [Trachymyrmex zeteki]|uniref:Uncharacterized protein n=1 Tax=Mycetomoellerius zeteki TaxID=64791 RepID=A0A151WWC9_9HYME|nr:hypothetical protein ALC60_08864 [Trachymyrmex zeteki]